MEYVRMLKTKWTAVIEIEIALEALEGASGSNTKMAS